MLQALESGKARLAAMFTLAAVAMVPMLLALVDAASAEPGDPPTVSYSGIKEGVFDQITAALPTVLAVLGVVIGITFGIRFIRRHVK